MGRRMGVGGVNVAVFEDKNTKRVGFFSPIYFLTSRTHLPPHVFRKQSHMPFFKGHMVKNGEGVGGEGFTTKLARHTHTLEPRLPFKDN